MAEGMFGAPVGLVAAGEENAKALSAAASGLRVIDDLQLQPYKMAQYAATADQHSMDAMLKRNQLITQARLAAGAAAGPADETPSARMRRIGEIAMGAGDAKLGADLLSKSVQADQRAASTDRAAAQADRATLQAIKEQSGMVAGLLRPVTDQQSYNRARMIAASQGLDVSQLPEEYNPALVAHMVNGAESVDRQITHQINQGNLTLREKELKLKESEAETRRTLSKARERLINRREEKLAKEGGGAKVVASASKGDIEAAEDIINKEYPGLKDRTAAYEIASQAKALVKNNPGLDMSEAIHRAFAQAKENGLFQPGGYLGLKSPGYASGRTPETAIPVRSAPTKPLVGRYYQTPNGLMLRREGGWEKVTGSTVAPVSPLTGGDGGGGDQDDDDEDDDE